MIGKYRPTRTISPPRRRFCCVIHHVLVPGDADDNVGAESLGDLVDLVDDRYLLRVEDHIGPHLLGEARVAPSPRPRRSHTRCRRIWPPSAHRCRSACSHRPPPSSPPAWSWRRRVRRSRTAPWSSRSRPRSRGPASRRKPRGRTEYWRCPVGVDADDLHVGGRCAGDRSCTESSARRECGVSAATRSPFLKRPTLLPHFDYFSGILVPNRWRGNSIREEAYSFH